MLYFFNDGDAKKVKAIVTPDASKSADKDEFLVLAGDEEIIILGTEEQVSRLKAEAMRQKVSWPTRKMKKVDWIRPARQAGFIIVSLALRWVVWGILGALRIFKIFDYLFLVYPGTPSDLDGYCPRKLARSWWFSKKPTVGGIISKGQGGVRGLYFVVPNTAKEFIQNDVSEEVRERLAWLNKLVGSRAVAIAGQVPGIMFRDGVVIEKPFVRGNKGTVFCVMETISEAMKKHERKSAETKIVVVGVGYVGGLLLDELRAEGYKATGADIKAKDNGYVVLGEKAKLSLSQADLVVVLTPKGSDFAPYVKLLKEGAIVIDDTHPKIIDRPANVHFYKVAVGMSGTKFFPRLPGYRPDWIPGCALEAIFSAATGEFNGMPQAEFNRRAKESGFFAHLVS